MSQLALDLGLRPALGRDDFLVTASNEAAVTLIDAWPNWPSHAAAIIGPPGSGKTHLAEVFRQRSGAGRMTTAELTVEIVPEALAGGSLVVELDGSALEQRALFHALNYAVQREAQVLLTSEVPLKQVNASLPDLRSRLNAIPEVNILLPDDALLRGVLVKQFADRQIMVGESVIAYLTQRIPRSLDFARTIVAEIDRQAMAERADVTRPFVARVLEGFTNPALFGGDGGSFT